MYAKIRHMRYTFPKNFLWGAATSAHQIEGNNKNNDWWAAEQSGLLPHKSATACDSYHRYEEDFDLAKGMSNNAHRLSIEWSRIEPREGEFNQKEIDHYKKVIAALKERGLEPFVTLHHFTNPTWFARAGGWTWDKAPERFGRYAQHVARHLGPDVRFWITINEPLVVNSAAYLSGRWPPFFTRAFIRSLRATRAMVEAHKYAYHAILTERSDAQVGIAKNNNYFESVGSGVRGFLNQAIEKSSTYVKNTWFLDAIANYQDFIGLNYYSHYKIDLGRIYQEGSERSDFDWVIYPEGLYHVLKSLQKYHKPVYITENGVADEDDDQRPSFIREHLRWTHRAIEEGVDVRGYFYWSLLDNFEWAEGFTKRFGLVAVDFETFERTPRESYGVYKEICQNNGL